MDYKSFWTFDRYAVVGHTTVKPFPKLTYGQLKLLGKTVYPVDTSVDEINEGDTTFPDLKSLPESVDGIIIETPPEESENWVQQAADAGIKNVWIHQRCDTPEAKSLAKEKGIKLWTGTCAVMYLTSGFNAHGIHRTINKIFGKY